MNLLWSVDALHLSGSFIVLSLDGVVKAIEIFRYGFGIGAKLAPEGYNTGVNIMKGVQNDETLFGTAAGSRNGTGRVQS